MKLKKILIIIQRSNGDVFYSNTLVNELKKIDQEFQIDLLVNSDTSPLANLINDVDKVIEFSYAKKHNDGKKYLIKLAKRIFKKYDISINLTSSDRSVFFAIISAKKSFSIIEKDFRKSWWKKILLDYYDYFYADRNILTHTLLPLRLFNSNSSNNKLVSKIEPSEQDFKKVNKILEEVKINDFIIFHPCAQYSYKVLPEAKIIKLVNMLSSIGLPVVISGGSSSIDKGIRKIIPKGKNIFNFIGKLNISEYIALSNLSKCYVGMDTLNMHIAYSQKKRVFAIFGPTNHKAWAPYAENYLSALERNKGVANYQNVTIFQADMSCVPCGKAGCHDDKGRSLCMENIDIEKIYKAVKKWICD